MVKSLEESGLVKQLIIKEKKNNLDFLACHCYLH